MIFFLFLDILKQIFSFSLLKFNFFDNFKFISLSMYSYPYTKLIKESDKVIINCLTMITENIIYLLLSKYTINRWVLRRQNTYLFNIIFSVAVYSIWNEMKNSNRSYEIVYFHIFRSWLGTILLKGLKIFYYITV